MRTALGEAQFEYALYAAASLLSALALPQRQPLKGTDWGDAESVAELRVGDFACGTGTLLSTAYQRLGLLHEIRVGDP